MSVCACMSVSLMRRRMTDDQREDETEEDEFKG